MVLLPGCSCCTCLSGDACNYSLTINGQNFPGTCEPAPTPASQQANICTGPYVDAFFPNDPLPWTAASRIQTRGVGQGQILEGSRYLEMYIDNVTAGFTPVSFASLEFAIILSFPTPQVIITSALRWEFVAGSFSATVYYRRTKTRRWVGDFDMGPCVFRENAFCDGVPRLSSLLPGSVSVDVQDGNATASVGGASVNLTLSQNTDVETGTGAGFDFWGARYPILACQKQAAESFSLNATVFYDPHCPGSSAP